MLNNKRGISDIVATVLIILIAIVAISLVAYFVYGFITKARDNADYSLMLNAVEFEVSSVTLDPVSNNVTVTVFMESGGDDAPEGSSIFPVVVLENKNGELKSIDKFSTKTFTPYSSNTIIITPEEHGFDDLASPITKVSVIPAVVKADGDIYRSQRETSTKNVVACGDGVKAGSEQCDDGNILDGDGCSSTCTIVINCGNGNIDAGEQCDDSNTITETCVYGQVSCIVCNNVCNNASGATQYCGDSIKNGPEQCDAGLSGNSTCTTGCIITGGSPTGLALWAIMNSPNAALGNILLTSTVYDNQTATIDIELYANRSTGSGGNIDNFFLYKQLGLSNASTTNYNITALPTDPTSSGLVALWHFDNRSTFRENETNVVDFVGGDANGTIIWNAQYATGKFGYGIKLFGANSSNPTKGYVDFPDTQRTIPDGSNFTISAWVYPTSNQYGVIDVFGSSYSSTQNGRGYGLTSSPTLHSVIVGNGTSLRVADCPALTYNQWNHITGVFNGTNLVCYRNGINGAVQPAALGGVYPRPNAAASEVIGTSFEGWETYNGTIDEVAVWTRALTKSEVQNLYNLTSGSYNWKIKMTDSLGRTGQNASTFTVA